MDILVIDVGGTHIKVLATDQKKPFKIRSGPKMSAKGRVRAVRQATKADDVVIGGGNAKSLRTPPKGVRLGSTANGFIGGYRLRKQHA